MGGLLHAIMPAMLIVIGGKLGSGRRGLAKQVAARLGYHYCSLDTYKPTDFFRGKDGVLSEHRKGPVDDGQRKLLYGRMAADMHLLAKMHEGVVVEAPFDYEHVRTSFMKEASREFRHSAFVWVTADDSYVQERLEHLQKKGDIKSIAHGVEMRARAQEPSLDEHAVWFTRAPDSEVSAERLITELGPYLA